MVAAPEVRKGTLAPGLAADQALPPGRGAAVASPPWRSLQTRLARKRRRRSPSRRAGGGRTTSRARPRCWRCWRPWPPARTRTSSRTPSSQTEASDQWSYYQAKSIKKHINTGQLEMERALAAGRPDLALALAQLEAGAAAAAKRYDAELAEIKGRAETLDAAKARHQKQGDRFQYAFVVLQAGVVLSTIAASARRRELWLFAILCGLLGLAMVVNSYLLFV